MTEKASTERLRGVSETLLMPLWARAAELDRPAPLVRDVRARQLLEAIDYDFEKFVEAHVDTVGYCVRAVIVDDLVQRFLVEYPDATVVEMGVGLDARFDRIDNQRARWFELDLPETIELRRQLIEETPRRTMLEGSVLERDWLAVLPEGEPTKRLFVADGLFYFMTRRQVADLFRDIADAFPGSQIVFDCQSPMYLYYCNRRHPLKDSQLVFSLTWISDIERWDPRFRVKEYVGFGDSPEYDRLMPRFSLVTRIARRFFPPLRHMFKITRVELG
jgi:O-methyltransferase involved in polyketide biosynthesis